jgi:hypothetical protein
MNDSLLSRFEATEVKVSKKRYVVELSADERCPRTLARTRVSAP